jgi:hypothetical protein
MKNKIRDIAFCKSQKFFGGLLVHSCGKILKIIHLIVAHSSLTGKQLCRQGHQLYAVCSMYLRGKCMELHRTALSVLTVQCMDKRERMNISVPDSACRTFRKWHCRCQHWQMGPMFR